MRQGITNLVVDMAFLSLDNEFNAQMLNLQRLQTIERRRVGGRTVTAKEGKWRVTVLFLLVVLGILANWFWGIGWEYLADPEKGIQLGPLLAVIVRIVLSFFAAALTFVPAYNKINQSTQESWVPYLLAFQNGFFWQAALDAVARQFSG